MLIVSSRKEFVNLPSAKRACRGSIRAVATSQASGNLLKQVGMADLNGPDTHFTILTVHNPVSGDRASPPAPGT